MNASFESRLDWVATPDLHSPRSRRALVVPSPKLIHLSDLGLECIDLGSPSLELIPLGDLGLEGIDLGDQDAKLFYFDSPNLERNDPRDLSPKPVDLGGQATEADDLHFQRAEQVYFNSVLLGIPFGSFGMLTEPRGLALMMAPFGREGHQ
ncbi:hypothetical protein GUJ93_ZPchr0016g2536 [Zizania palustris]|uniref:Uncharacterized protein n=1 Tax=Zizania palustris TaxID=103762 RepID=A0A8J5W158_ZIZPA|nr:hypothetical protein GUJ93_ZPchr0016g2536 [Zizania palustris]